MPLTPTDVANKQFRIAFRGYSLDEVDAFLDEVENELARLLRDNAALRERPAATAATPAAVAAAPPEAPLPQLGAMEGQEAALRTLLLAQRTADEAIAEARAEAEEIVSSARAEADTTLTGARAEADTTLSSARAEADKTLTGARAEAERTLTGARQKAAQLEQEVSARVAAATGDLEQRRQSLEARIEELRVFEREYRTRLKAYLETQLRELTSGGGGDDAGAGVPPGARSAAVTGRPGAAAPPAPAPAGPAQQDAPAGPPREAAAPSTLRAVPPVQSGATPVGPFTVVPSGDGSDGPAEQ